VQEPLQQWKRAHQAHRSSDSSPIQFCETWWVKISAMVAIDDGDDGGESLVERVNASSDAQSCLLPSVHLSLIDAAALGSSLYGRYTESTYHQKPFNERKLVLFRKGSQPRLALALCIVLPLGVSVGSFESSRCSAPKTSEMPLIDEPFDAIMLLTTPYVVTISCQGRPLTTGLLTHSAGSSLLSNIMPLFLDHERTCALYISFWLLSGPTRLTSSVTLGTSW
jgi:hypothetical protein